MNRGATVVLRKELPLTLLLTFHVLARSVGQLERADDPVVNVPAPASVRVAAAEVRVLPDRAGWTYAQAPGDVGACWQLSLEE